MDQCTHEVRLQHWKNIISQCQARPSGQTAKQWLAENGICEQTYYLWQRRIRQETYELMTASAEVIPISPEKEEISFAEIPYKTSNTSSGNVAGPAAKLNTRLYLFINSSPSLDISTII